MKGLAVDLATLITNAVGYVTLIVLLAGFIVRLEKRMGERLALSEARMDERFHRVEADISGVATDVAEIKTDVVGLKVSVARLDVKVAGLQASVARLEGDPPTLLRVRG